MRPKPVENGPRKFTGLLSCCMFPMRRLPDSKPFSIGKSDNSRPYTNKRVLAAGALFSSLSDSLPSQKPIGLFCEKGCDDVCVSDDRTAWRGYS